MNVGSVLQESVHHLRVAVLGGGGERRATVLPQTHTHTKETKEGFITIVTEGNSTEVLSFRRMTGSESHNQRSANSSGDHSYLCPALSGGTKFKEELHNLIMTLLGGKKQGGGACLEERIKINTAVFASNAVLSFSLHANTNATTERFCCVL